MTTERAAILFRETPKGSNEIITCAGKVPFENNTAVTTREGRANQKDLDPSRLVNKSGQLLTGPL